MTDTTLRILCAEWQKRLRLQDWNVQVYLCPGADTSGRTRISAQMKEARVFICSEDTWHADWLGAPNQEVVLVHELLHLHSRSFDSKVPADSVEWDALETMIELTANALVEAKHQAA